MNKEIIDNNVKYDICNTIVCRKCKAILTLDEVGFIGCPKCRNDTFEVKVVKVTIPNSTIFEFYKKGNLNTLVDKVTKRFER